LGPPSEVLPCDRRDRNTSIPTTVRRSPDLEPTTTDNRDGLMPSHREKDTTTMNPSTIAPANEIDTSCPVPREVKVMVRGESQSPTRINLASGTFRMVIDEPASMGGTNEGPSPMQVLLMSLAGCLNVTGHEVARQRGLDLRSFSVRIEGVMNPCAFVGCSSEERAGFQSIDVSVDADMRGATESEMASWLEETEDRCPVTDNIRADTNLAVVLTSR